MIGFLYVLSLVFSAYTLGYYVLGYVVMRRNVGAVGPGRGGSILVVIAAHNEERVLSGILSDLAGQSYHNFEVCVLADNCSDGTVGIARGFGVRVYERVSVLKGKQFALQELFRAGWVKDFGHVLVLDADNRVPSGFLEQMDREVSSGSEVVQAYLDMSNKRHTWVSRAYWVNYRLMNVAVQRVRDVLGLPVFLGGTGYIFPTKYLGAFEGCDSLVEDLEMSVRFALMGVRVRFTEKTRVFDEKPTKFRASYVQRLRWMRGTFQVMRRYFVPLCSAVWRGEGFKYFDLLIYLSNYYVAALTAGLFVFALVSALFTGALWGFVAYQFLYLAVFLVFDRNSGWRSALYALPAFVFNLSNLPLYVHGFFTQGSRSWVRTEHMGG